MRRHQLYLRLIDISFWISIVFVLRFFAILAGILPPKIPSPLGPLVATAFTLNSPLAIFLIVARFMRDEFAERIWHKAAEIFIYVLVSVPIVAAVLIRLSEAQIREGVSNDWVSPKILHELQLHPDPVWNFVAGLGWALIGFALLAPTIFICIYRFALWQDGR